MTVLGSLHKPKDEQGGLLCLISDEGEVQAQAQLEMPAGMALTDRGLLVASLFDIHELSLDLSIVQQNAVSLPTFNMLHSLSRTRQGYLVASTGLDALFEFSADGKLLWEWWATDHGFDLTPTGEPRIIDKTDDHRGVKYGTLAQTTHVNSAAELPDGTILATLFHQGTLIAIDRSTGEWQVVLDGLDHPHSVRVLDEHFVTLADTGRGQALFVNIQNLKGKIEASVPVQTNWLQDSYYDTRADKWYLVDGKNTRVIVRSGLNGEKEVAQFELDPEWRLYEVLPL
ncbi:hypothetical protein KTT_36450 [Tengunoibacter tsumagoiensis]|uniref:Lipoprotein LpqB beta-propeller domain-containing protein n=1 Tax=Tengunoibacter tsumagoiensis TaxID=2014871 RepID=A0A402A406_9CHLR|nr:hypothetical protein KTT_36450 [Tengunoibacter tsumagoiensis]